MKKIYIVPVLDIENIEEDINILAASPIDPNSDYSLGGGGGSDNRSDKGVGLDEGDALSKGGFFEDDAEW